MKTALILLLGIVIGFSIAFAAEDLIPQAQMQSYKCYRDGGNTFMIKIDGKMASAHDNKFYPVIMVGIPSLDFLYHRVVLKDLVPVDCE